MATLLKDLKLTSVDLVRAGANQEADICLFKSAEPQTAPEATESPTEAEKNVFKRFIDWLRKSATEAENEPHSPIEKEDRTATDKLYKSAIIESLASITADTSKSDDEKLDMVEKSLDQFYKKRTLLWDIDDEENEWDPDLEQEGTGSSQPSHEMDETEVDKSATIDEIEEVEKYNQNHDAAGRFSSGPGGGGAGVKIDYKPKALEFRIKNTFGQIERREAKILRSDKDVPVGYGKVGTIKDYTLWSNRSAKNIEYAKEIYATPNKTPKKKTPADYGFEAAGAENVAQNKTSMNKSAKDIIDEIEEIPNVGQAVRP